MQWLRDGLGLFEDAAESEALATSVEDNNGVYFVPAFTGLGAPHWDPNARASITGLTRESTAAHITGAALEAQAYQTLDLIEAMKTDSNHDTEIIRADGGLMNNEFACQFLADTLGKSNEIPKNTETTATGVAYLAGLQVASITGLRIPEKHGGANDPMNLQWVQELEQSCIIARKPRLRACLQSSHRPYFVNHKNPRDGKSAEITRSRIPCQTPLLCNAIPPYS